MSKDFYRSAQLRADQMFRDAIAEHRAKVKDTDLKNPGHMEAGFRYFFQYFYFVNKTVCSFVKTCSLIMINLIKLTIDPLRKNITNYIENLIGEDTSISDELQTEGRWKESFFFINS